MKVATTHRIISAACFGAFASLLTLPLVVLRLTQLPVGEDFKMKAYLLFIEGALPVMLAVSFGSILGARINKDSGLSAAFGVGLILVIPVVVLWIVAALLSASVLFPYPLSSRLAGNVFVMGLFGIPIYGLVGGFAGLSVRALARRGR